MECRICFEQGDLLDKVCNCKGSQRYIHSTCLIKIINHINSEKCPTCKSPYFYNPVKPRLWKYLNSFGFELFIKLFHLLFYQYDKDKSLEFAYYNNLFLICLYTYSYSNLFKTLTFKEVWFWTKPYIRYRGNYYFPILLLIYIVLTYHCGLLLIFYVPYSKLYEIQKVIDEF